MTRTNPRLALLLTIALGIGGAAVFVASSAGGQSEGVPVDFTPSNLDRVDLHFWRVNGSSATNCNVFSQAGGDVDAPDTAGVCQARIASPTGATSSTETREIQHADQTQWDDNPGVRFALDISPGSAAPDGAAYPFTIDAHPSALETQFYFSTDRFCTDAASVMPVDFYVRHFKVDEAELDGPPQSGLFENPFATGTETGCHSSGTNELTVTAAPDEPVTFQRDEVLVTEIVAAAPEGDSNTTWTTYFESEDTPAHVTVRTDEVVEKAVWATDRTGTPKDTFDPDAPEGDRYLVPQAALRSPFGAEAVPGEDNQVGIQDPNGTYVDLVTDDDGTTTTLALEEIQDLRKRSGSYKVFEIEHPEDQTQPWHYPENVQNGPYTIVVDSEIAGSATTFEHTVAMGAFDFSMEPVDGESTTHLLQQGSSTTFLVNLTNTGSDVDSYEVNADFSLSGEGETWNVDLIGVDQNNRVSVNPGENTLLRVKVTPPEGVSVGDRGRVDLVATSANSGAENNLTLEAQVTDSTVRDVGALVVADQPVKIGIDEKTRLHAFAWNQGTATDGMSIALVPNSTQAENPDSFDIEVAQGEVTGVSPGNVARVPIDVTTDPGVSQGDEVSFDLSVQSRADTSVQTTITLDAEVTADRGLKIVGLNHQNEEALESLRYSRFNRSQEGPNGDEVAGTCEPSVRGQPQRPEECKDFHNWTYHRAIVTNTGDQTETIDLSILPAGDQDSLPGRTTAVPSSDCTPILEDRLQRMQENEDVEPVAMVDQINHADPGSESPISEVQLAPDESDIVYLRVGYDGFTPYHEDVSPADACSQESFHATVLASLDDGQDQRLTTETVFPFDNTQDMPNAAQARLALLDDYVREDGSYATLPVRTGLELGETTTINFTLSMQQGHEDRTRVEVISDAVSTLEDEGWDIELVSLGPDAEVVDDHEIVVPAESVLADDTSVGHASGVDYKLGLKVTPPASGPQESERHQFAIQASSEEDSTEQDTLTIGTQIGQTYAFDVDPGEQTIRAHPGDEVAFGLTVLNEGASRDSYHIDVNASSSAVDVSAEPADPRISSGSAQTSSIRVDVGSGATQNDEVTITATVRADRGTANDRSDDLGPRTVEYTLDVRSPSTLSMEAQRSVVSVSPGGETAIDFSITNEKDTPQNLVVSQIVGPPGWDTSLSDSDEERRIAGGETITQTVLVEAPQSIVEGSTFPFVVQAENVSAENEFAVATSEAIAQGQTALSLEIERNRTQVVDRGDTTRFPILVRNPGTSPTRYQLSTSFESEDWLGRFLEADTGNVLADQTVKVPENEFRRVLVEVQAPNEVDRGHVEDVTVSGFAKGQRDVTDEVSLEAAIHDFGVEIDVTGAQAKDVAPGDNAAFQVAITNTGNGEDEISLSFASPSGESPTYPVTSALTDDTTPTLAPGETLENVTVEVQVPSPSPDSSPVTSEEGIATVIEARSGANLASDTVPTATAEVTTHLVDYVINDVDGDGAFEVALDLNRDLGDGYEVFRDQDVNLIERGELNSSQSVGSQGLHVVDADEDDRAEHVIDTDSDGVGNVYFDPDRARTYEIPYTVDVTGDAQAEHPIDADFDGVIDGVFDPADEVMRKTAHLDLSGDGRKDLLVDTNGDTRFDRYVNPHQQPALVTDVERDGDLYKVDTDGSGQVDTHYDVQTQSVQDAETANLQSFLGSYWYVIVVFLAVVVAFGAIFYRRL